jgi:selenocysteine lyase/cysteine desulfurase
MLRCKSGKFSLPERVTYLNCSYMSPQLKSVEKIGVKSLRRKRNPIDVTPDAFFHDTEILRQEFSKLINNPLPSQVAIIPSVSYGISTVARNLQISAGENIIVAADQFPSNYYPWQALCNEKGAALIRVAPEGSLKDRGKIWNEKILEAISNKTKAVAIANTHWADGTLFNLEAIRKRTSEVGALMVIDGTQSVGALPFDVQKLQPDALICAGYKWLLGPYSIGLAYYSEAFNNGKPLEENWISRLKSEDFSRLIDYQPAYQPGAMRYDVGERSNFILVPMQIKAIQQLNKWHVDLIQEYCANITRDAIDRLRQHGFWIEDENFRASHLFGVRLPSHVNIDIIKQALLKNKIYVSFRGDAIRVSPNVYNNELDMIRFTNALIGKKK